jgi:hypothetical protein
MEENDTVVAVGVGVDVDVCVPGKVVLLYAFRRYLKEQ